jgi:predicted metallopeptidase
MTGKDNVESKFKRGAKKEVFICDQDHEIYTTLREAINEHPYGHLIDPEKIKCVYVYDDINAKTFARVIKCNDYIKHMGKINFIIEVSGVRFDALTDKGKYQVILHELLHIHPKITKEGEIKEDDNGDAVLGLIQHDVLEFRYMIKKFGIDELYR